MPKDDRIWDNVSQNHFGISKLNMKKKKPSRGQPFQSETMHDPQLFERPLSSTTYIVFDLESTGGNPAKNRLTEICALKMSGGKILDRFYTLLNPRMTIPPIVRRMTGITNQMVRNAPTVEQVFPAFLRFVGDDILVSHNTVGDMTFLTYFAKHVCKHKLTNYFLCTHLLAEKLVNDAPNYSLTGLGDYLGLTVEGKSHRAEADAELTLKLFLELKRRLRATGISKTGEAIRFQGHLETNMRLGLALDERKIFKTPDEPGVFVLKGLSGDVLFASSALRLKSELQGLRYFDQVPRKLLRTVLQAYDFETITHPDIFSAMLHEAELYKKFQFAVEPYRWHGRVVTLLTLIVEQKEMHVAISPFESSHIRYGYGPVKDYKVVQAKLRTLQDIVASRVVRNSISIPHDRQRLFESLFQGRLVEELSRLRWERVRLRNLLNLPQQKIIAENIAVAKQLVDLNLLDGLVSLSDLDGVISVRHGDDHELYPIIGSCPLKPKSIVRKGEDLEKARKNMFSHFKKRTQTHRVLDANKVGATIWTIVVGAKKKHLGCEFFPEGERQEASP